MYYKKLLCYRSGISETQIALPSLPELILVWHHWSGGDKVTLGCILGAFEGILTPPLAWPAPFCPICLFLLLHICSGPAQGTGMGLITAALVFSCFPFTPSAVCWVPLPHSSSSSGKGRGCFSSSAAGKKFLLCWNCSSACARSEIGWETLWFQESCFHKLSHLEDGFLHHVV